MATSNFIKNDVCGVCKVVDNAGVTLTVPFDRGSVKIGPLSKVLNEITKYESRGRLRGVGVGARIYPTVEFSAWIAEWTNASAGNLVDFLLQRNGYSGNISTLGSSHPVYTCDFSLVIEGTNYGDDADTTVVCEDVRFTFEFQESMDGNGVTVSGEVLGRVLINGTVVAQEVQ